MEKTWVLKLLLWGGGGRGVIKVFPIPMFSYNLLQEVTVSVFFNSALAPFLEMCNAVR